MCRFVVGLVVLGMAQLFTTTAASGEFKVIPTTNPRYCPNELFPAFEDFHSPRIAQLRARYKLDDVVKGESDEP